MIRKIALAGAAGAVALSGLAFTGGGVAHAAKPTLTDVTSADVSCTITAKATLVPSLKNNWLPVQHNGINDHPGFPLGDEGDVYQSELENPGQDGTPHRNDNEPMQVVKDLPFTQFAALNTPNATTAKAKGDCEGTITGTRGPGDPETTTMTVTKVKVTLTTLTNSVDNSPFNNNGGSTCIGLLSGTADEDEAATFRSAISLKGSGAKVPAFNIDGSSVVPEGLGFAITGGTADAPFTGATGVSQANVDLTTLLAVLDGPPSSLAPKATSKCQPSLKVKQATSTKPASATLKAPKGLKKLGISSGTFTLEK